MAPAKYNERKLEILELVEAGFDTSDIIAEYCGISQSFASTLLAHYWRQGLLHRYPGPLNNEKIYDLSERGNERIAWLQSTIHQSEKNSQAY
jgi:DNA-binding MarR family transcriptional regulator